jgi:adenylate cyclase
MQPASSVPTLRDRLLLAERAHAASRALLRKILPDSVIDRLIAHPEACIADEFANASVMFADIEGFVTIAKKLGHRRTVALLDSLTREFDVLAVGHGVEKIKTIGDGYMAVAGVPELQTDHCERLARLALNMMKIAETIGAGFGVRVSLRIGISAGPVTAGVIGANKFTYDVWGDTVNLASRLEKLAGSGQILISSDTKAQLPRGFRLGRCKTIAIRGLGPVKVCALHAAPGAASYAN